MRFRLSAIIGCAVVSLAAANPARAEAPTLPELPAALQPGALKPYLAAFAKGVQIYVCSKSEAGAWSWTFKAPEAELADASGTKLGRHYGGPTWEGVDGAKVVGAKKASASAPAANAVPWLLLDVKSREGSGAFAQASGILRVATQGGSAPASGCDEAHAGAEQRSPYTATYYFLK
jgi:hypothetical protein